MSLRFSFENVENSKEFTTYEEDGQEYWQGWIEVFCVTMCNIGIGKITEDNLDEVIRRLTVYSVVSEIDLNFLLRDHGIIFKCVGFTVNAIPMTNAQFKKETQRWLDLTVKDRIRYYKKPNND